MRKPCEIDDCPHPHTAAGFCEVSSFLEKIASGDPNECWEWRAARDSKGYGIFGLTRGNQKAHRYSYQHFIGPIPGGLLIRHRCDNPPCVNPRHLEPGTHLENMADHRERKRPRQPKKLSEAQVIEIHLSDRPYKELAAKYGVSASAVGKIHRGQMRERALEKVAA